ncbi:MAG: hypothetical protein AB8H79_23045 [Myxococcota bacterium]
MLRTGALLATIACAADAPAAPAPTEPAPVVVPAVSMGGDWVIVEENSEFMVFRWGQSPHGVRLNLVSVDGRQVGVSPIVGGRTLEVRSGSDVAPAFAWPWPQHPLTAANIEVQGPDLLIRLQGPPLNTLTDHPDAPEDPALSWVRLRPRGESWRIALRGVHRMNLPGPVMVEHLGDRRVLHSEVGTFELTTDARAASSASTARMWTLDTRPNLDLARPYPKTGLTWRPDAH